jgi:hypothetical protein
MAIVQGIKEKCHLPIYDSFTVDAGQQLGEVENSSTLKFFVNVQGKTKLETNLQSASLLPHYNTFEARAMRVVISDLPPEFPSDVKVTDESPVTDEEGFQVFVDGDGNVLDVDENGDPITPPDNASTEEDESAAYSVFAEFELGLGRIMELLTEARENSDHLTFIDVDEEGVTISAFDDDDNEVDIDNTTLVTNVLAGGGSIEMSVGDLERLIDEQVDQQDQPPKEQLNPNNGSGTIIGKLIYNTVTTLYVGEKIMIQMPTWFFPAGAGPYSETGRFTTHGEPSPMATFRFAEAIQVDKGQNFRVEMEIPDTDVLKEIQRIYGPLNIWVVLDGYMTRDVQ